LSFGICSEPLGTLGQLEIKANTNMKKYKFCLLILIYLMPLVVFASGAQVKPSKINLEVTNDSSDAFLSVFNPSSEVQLFEVYPDDFEDIIAIKPKSFTLEAGENKKVKITVSASKNIQNSQIFTTISVVSKPLSDSGFSVGAGIKVPVTMSFAQNGQTYYLNYLTPSLALLFILLLVLFKKYPLLLKKMVK
jgi:hypothetical protein